MYLTLAAVFPIGEVCTAVVGLQNRGSKTVNVTAIFGSLNSQFQFHVFVQNVRPGLVVGISCVL